MSGAGARLPNGGGGPVRSLRPLEGGNIRPPQAEAESTSHRGRAYLYVTLATCCWATNAIAVKVLVRDLPALPATSMRVALAALSLLAVQAAAGRKAGRGSLVAARELLPLGVFGIGLSFLCYTTALSYTSVSHVVFIGALTPAMVLVAAAWQRQERVTPLKLAGLAISMAGVLLLELDKPSGAAASWKGDLIAAAGIACFTYYTVRSKRAAAALDSLTLNIYAFAIGAICFLPLLVWGASRIAWADVPGLAWAALLYSGTVGSACAYFLYYAALRTLTPSQVAVFQYLQPILSTLFGVALLHEIFGASFGAGAALILAGVFLAERR